MDGDTRGGAQRGRRDGPANQNLQRKRSFNFKTHLHRGKAEAKAKIFFGACRLLFDLFRFRSNLT